MILIADSGSTKTDWALVGEDGESVKRFASQGINPVHQSEDYIFKVICDVRDSWCDMHRAEHSIRLFFYGAGCVEPWSEQVRNVLSKCFPQAEILSVASDLLGAARAVCGHEHGIACILGTGANSCLYDGERIVKNVPPLGYILGDEGSGAVLGRMFFNAIFKGSLPETLRDDYLRTMGITYSDVIERVYRQPLANRFLASTSLYISQHLDCEGLRDLVKENFRQFFRKNISHYDSRHLPVGAVGSVAWFYKPLLAEVALEEGYQLGVICKSPIEGLITFHLGKS